MSTVSHPPTFQKYYYHPNSQSYDSLPETEIGHYQRQETIEAVRRLNNIPPGVPVNLHALPDPPPGVRPSQTLASLVQLAIVGSPNLQLCLRDIYTAIEDRFPYFRTGEKKWQVCISEKW